MALPAGEAEFRFDTPSHSTVVRGPAHLSRLQVWTQVFSRKAKHRREFSHLFPHEGKVPAAGLARNKIDSDARCRVVSSHSANPDSSGSGESDPEPETPEARKRRQRGNLTSRHLRLIDGLRWFDWLGGCHCAASFRTI